VGHEVALLLARKGAHVVVADLDAESAKSVANEVAKISSSDTVASTVTDLANSESLAEVVKFTILQFGGIDAVVNTAAILSGARRERPIDVGAVVENFPNQRNWKLSTGRKRQNGCSKIRIFRCIALTSSANALVPKKGTEAYDTSKTAVNHLIRELAVGLAQAGVSVTGSLPGAKPTASSRIR